MLLLVNSNNKRGGAAVGCCKYKYNASSVQSITDIFYIESIIFKECKKLGITARFFQDIKTKTSGSKLNQWKNEH